MALKPPAKILRILGYPDPTLERVHVGIYDYLDQLVSLTGSFGFNTTNIIAGTAKPATAAPAFFPHMDPADDSSGDVFIPPAPASGGITQLTSDVTAGPGSGSQVATIAANAVTNAKLATGAPLSVIVRNINSVGNRTDISTTSGSDFPLRENGGVIDWGTLATRAYGTNTVTYAKLQTTSAGDLLLGRGNVGAGNVQEVNLDATSLAFNAGGTVLKALAPQFTLCWGGLMTGIGAPAVLPAFIGIGDSGFTAHTLGADRQFTVPVDCTTQDFAVIVTRNTLGGTAGTLFSWGLYKNNVLVDTLGAVSTATGATPLPNFAVRTSHVFGHGTPGDRASIVFSVQTGTPSGGDLLFYIVGRFYTA